MTKSREIRLKSRPTGMPVADNFELATVELPPPTAGHDRPSDARHLVGNGNGDELGRLLGQQLRDPWMLLRMPPGLSNNGCCTDDE